MNQVHTQVGGHPSGFAATLRKDRWWIGPILTALGLSAFGAYSTWAAFQGNHYWAVSYLSPFYSPVLFVNSLAAGAAPIQHAWLGEWPNWWPNIIPASPALLILAFPLSFRATCYYYRKAYYRSFFGSPPGCAVGAVPQKSYKGETFLLLVQNFHRYAMYIALCFIGILYYDAFIAFFHEGKFGVGVGSVVLLLNATFLGLYTTGCHSFRHIIGGRMDQMTCIKSGGQGCPKIRHGLWGRVSALNEKHMLFAWISLFWVGFSDFYVRMVSLGYITDFNTWGIY
jgi:hypothetical protein